MNRRVYLTKESFFEKNEAQFRKELSGIQLPENINLLQNFLILTYQIKLPYKLYIDDLIEINLEIEEKLPFEIISSISRDAK